METQSLTDNNMLVRDTSDCIEQLLVKIRMMEMQIKELQYQVKTEIPAIKSRLKVLGGRYRT